MSKVFSAHAVSVDGYISGRDPSDADGGFGRGLGVAPMLFDWYRDGDTPSQAFDGFRCRSCSAAEGRSSRRCPRTCTSTSSKPYRRRA